MCRHLTANPFIVSMLLLMPGTLMAEKSVWRACPEKSQNSSCDFVGNNSLQQAVDAANNGDQITVAAGVYHPTSTRNIKFGELDIRAYVLIDNKSLTITGDEGAILNGEEGKPSCAFVINNGVAVISTLSINNFRYQLAEDDIYDGHGVFIINSKVILNNIELRNIQKMSVSTHGNSDVELNGLKTYDGHLGLWTNDTSSVSVLNSELSTNESSGIAAYHYSAVRVDNTVLEHNGDDGIFAEDNANITVTNSVVVNNKPYGLRANENSQISIDKSYVFGNEDNYSNVVPGDKENIHVGAEMLLDAPRVFPAQKAGQK